MERMSDNHNCPNCGAPIDPYMIHCKYCDTYYFDLSAFDCSKQCFVKFKSGSHIITALAQPEVTDVEVTTNEYRYGVSRYMTANRYCDIKAVFHCLANPENNSMFTVVEEKTE